jgi:hypothetical protein
MYFFAGLFLGTLSPVFDQTQGSGAVFSLLYGQLYYLFKTLYLLFGLLLELFKGQFPHGYNLLENAVQLLR